MNIWQPMATAPRDGEPVWLCDRLGNAGGPYPMYWDSDGTNPLFQRGFGIWTLHGGGLTWTDEGLGAPELWAPRTSNICPAPPWVTQQ